jgi:hypothetical protein
MNEYRDYCVRFGEKNGPDVSPLTFNEWQAVLGEKCLLDALDDVGAVYAIDGVLWRYEVDTVSYPEGQEEIDVLYPVEFGREDDESEPATAIVNPDSVIVKQWKDNRKKNKFGFYVENKAHSFK